ncbi:MAG TPA: hypothetical protein VFQ23_13410, partial [Anaerolineales bacterium]|nr:hypothetical protein [Anaerolineales bacterium]
MNRTKQSFHPVFYVLMILYLIFAYSTLGWGESWAASLYPEDHYFENVGAVSFLAATVISLFVYMRAVTKRYITQMHWVKLSVYAVLALIYFFGAGEELSWGERIFLPPVLDSANAPEELKIQNLAIIENNEFLTGDNIYTLFWMGFAVAIPVLSRVWKRFKGFAETFTPIVYWGIGVLFLLNYFFAQLANLFYRTAFNSQTILFPQALQEVKESNYQLLFVFLSLLVLWDLNSRVFPKSNYGSPYRLPELNRVRTTDQP